MRLEISIHTTTQVVTGLTGCRRQGYSYFNPHHHAGGDSWNSWLFDSIYYFNPHHHAGGDLETALHKAFENRFQSTPPRRWWPRQPDKVRGRRVISIHTTTQVVTKGDIVGLGEYIISIHTTTQVVTSSSHEGSSGDAISIHTTTQVVTPQKWLELFAGYISIHTTTQVVTLSQAGLTTTLLKFQSTPPRRWWPSGISLHYCNSKYFNPHHHAGGDRVKKTSTRITFNFNPHHHAGGDKSCWRQSKVLI